MKKQEWESTFAEFAEAVITESRAPGLVMGVNKDGQSLYRKGFGYRNRERKLEITPDTVMGLASVTKSFTCMAIMQLQEAGKLSVHDPVLTYLPEFRTPDRGKTEQMTIHHFMTHSAGLPPLPADILAIKHSLYDDIAEENHPIHKFLKKEDQKPIHTSEELLAVLGKLDYELLGVPGQYFSYSNDAYSLLGAIIARVSGKPYDVYVKEHILEPAGMSSSTFQLGDLSGMPDVTTIYHFRDKDGGSEVYPDPNWEEGPAVLASGHLNSTVHDMLKYAEIFRTGGLVGKERILSEESVRQMTRPHIRCNYGRYYGYGLMVHPDYFGGTLLKHGGAIKGVAAHLAIVPERGITAVVLANLVGTPVEKLTLAALNGVEGRPLGAAFETYEECSVPAERLPEYVGRYVSGEGMDVSVALADGALTLTENSGYSGSTSETYRLQAIGEDYFLTSLNGSEYTLGFTRGEDGTVKAIAFSYRQIPKVKSGEA